MSQEEAKLKISELIQKYEKVKESGEISRFSEEDTKTNFIIPLFGALGWNMHDRDEVTAEEQISGQRVDYGFYYEGHIKFYLEAKPLKAELHQEKFAQQAIRYSWNKGVTWAILTDFESLIVFNALSPEKALHGKKYFEIPYTEYLGRFDQLWLLSKDAFSKNILDQEAEKHGKKLQKVSVTENLSKDLNECRELLTNAFQTCNRGVSSDLIDEGVQKLLDRLIFIRVAEDRKIEPLTLRPLINQWIASGRQASPYIVMVEKFRELDAVYNSNLFSEHPFEKWEEFAGATEKVVDILYGKKSYFEYDFSVIPADVLGSVYENYLGYKMQKAPKKTTLFGEVAELSKDARKRKEHGIYYTPKFIVRYIVEHALGPVLDRCQSISDLQKIKVLDPACGSGSFLVAALDLILKKYESFGRKPDGLTKVQILQSNLYGVDLDQQAVELARLNLLLQTFDEQVKLPNLGNNIKNGNSLISGTDKELKKYFGKNYRDKRAFNWEEEFPEVFKQGGFDVVIGNPPYGADISEKEAEIFREKYNIGSTDTAILFIKKSFDLLKDDGMMAFIVPKAFCFASNWKKIRNFFWNGINAIIDCGKAWKEVKLEQIVFVFNKGAQAEEYLSGKFDGSKPKTTSKIAKKDAQPFDFFLNGVSQTELEIGKKMLSGSIMLNDISSNQRGAMLQKLIFTTGDKDVIGGAHVQRFGITGIKGKIDSGKIENEQAFLKDNSVLVQNIIAHIENPIDHIKITASIPQRNDYILVDTINQVTLIKDINPLSIWCILNSHLMSWYAYRFIFGKAIRTMHFDNSVTARIPIPDDFKNKQKNLSEFAKEILKINSELQSTVTNSNEFNDLNQKKERLNKKIDQEVYQLYGLTEEEIKIVEGKK